MILESPVGQHEAKHTRYQSYLLRLWQENDHDKPCWRISLESAQDGERRFFAGLEDLAAFLQQGTADRSKQKVFTNPSIKKGKSDYSVVNQLKNLEEKCPKKK
jgi:hypothetical protein